MAAIRLRSGLIGALVAVSGTLLIPSLGRAQAAAAADSGALFDTAAVRARSVASRLDATANGTRPRRADPAAQQYADAMAMVGRKQLDSALVPLRAAAAVNQNNARYHGDLGYVLAERGRLDDAGNEYGTAIRLQSANPWYYVGLGLIRLNQERWTEASANFELAYATDSTVVDPLLVAAASRAAEKTSDEGQLLQWSQRGTARFPDDPMPWLQLAMLLRSRGDTARGFDAIRRYRTLAPQDRRGAAIYAMYLYPRGQFDSAVVMARLAAPDSSLRQYASHVFLQAGAHWLNAKQYDSAAAVLEAALPITTSGLIRLRVMYWLGLADLMRIPTILNTAAHDKDCAKAPMLDSLLATVQKNVTDAAQAGDSAETSKILTNFVPTLRQRLDDFKQSCH